MTKSVKSLPSSIQSLPPLRIFQKHINLKLASSSNGNVFTWVSGKRPMPLSVLPVPSTFLRPQASSSWCFNPGSVRTSSGSKSPAIGKETWNY